jgi:hypothetical protein
MKHIIPTLTLTALVAGASAQQAPAPAGLNYNHITVSRTTDDNALTAQFNPAGSNFVIGFATGHGDNTDYGYGQLSAGYVFKGVVQGIDATVGVLQTNGEATRYTLVLRRALNEVYQGLEIAAGIASSLTSSEDDGEFVFGGVAIDQSKTVRYVELLYSLNKTFSVGVGLTEQDDYNTHTVFSVRAGF